MAKIFLFRHGQTSYNRDKMFTGFANPDLTSEGIKEAGEIGEKLKNENVNKAYSSDLIRSIHTLNLVLGIWHKNVDKIVDKRLRERDYGELTGKNKTQTAIEYPDKYPLWHRSYDVAPPGGESIKDVEKRVLPFIHDMLKSLKPEDIILISAHGNSLRPIRRYFENLTIKQMCSFEHQRAAIYNYTV